MTRATLSTHTPQVPIWLQLLNLQSYNGHLLPIVLGTGGSRMMLEDKDIALAKLNPAAATANAKF